MFLTIWARTLPLATKVSKAKVVTANPGGTRRPSRSISPRLAFLPPTRGKSLLEQSLNQMICFLPFEAMLFVQNKYGSQVSVHPDPLTCFDHLGAGEHVHNDRDSILPTHDGGMGKTCPSIYHHAIDHAKDRRPGRGGTHRYKDISLLDLRQIFISEDAPCNSFG